MAFERDVVLRDYLKSRTATQHDQLDAIAAPANLAPPHQYSGLLGKQWTARIGIELWVAENCPAALAPPPVCALIADDLASMNCPLPDCIAPFSMPEDADPLGLAWAIAGSSMGNLVMLRQLQKQAPDYPASFLADEQMRGFWQALRPRLERRFSLAQAQSALRAAAAVFDHFLAVFSASARPSVAA